VLVVAAIYVVGVLWGLLVIDARAPERVALALLWPLGPAAFVVTVTILLVVLPIAFPRVGIPLWTAAAALVWLLVIR
jgi:hypothetical protein